MASSGDRLRSLWTAAFYNKLQALLKQSVKASGAGPVTVTQTKDGIQVVLPRGRRAVSTLQGLLVGGSDPGVTDGTTIIDPCAWDAYSIQAAYFVLSAGTTTLTVMVNSTAVSWLDSLAISGTPAKLFIANPVPDLTHVLAPGDQLSIVLSGSSSDAAGLMFSLNCPF